MPHDECSHLLGLLVGCFLGKLLDFGGELALESDPLIVDVPYLDVHQE